MKMYLVKNIINNKEQKSAPYFFMGEFFCIVLNIIVLKTICHNYFNN